MRELWFSRMNAQAGCIWSKARRGAHLVLGRGGVPLLQTVEVNVPRVTFALAWCDLQPTRNGNIVEAQNTTPYQHTQWCECETTLLLHRATNLRAVHNVEGK